MLSPNCWTKTVRLRGSASPRQGRVYVRCPGRDSEPRLLSAEGDRQHDVAPGLAESHELDLLHRSRSKTSLQFGEPSHTVLFKKFGQELVGSGALVFEQEESWGHHVFPHPPRARS